MSTRLWDVATLSWLAQFKRVANGNIWFTNTLEIMLLSLTGFFFFLQKPFVWIPGHSRNGPFGSCGCVLRATRRRSGG